jgi:uncharacterized SAM-dependent methyltransferase
MADESEKIDYTRKALEDFRLGIIVNKSHGPIFDENNAYELGWRGGFPGISEAKPLLYPRLKKLIKEKDSDLISRDYLDFILDACQIDYSIFKPRYLESDMPESMTKELPPESKELLMDYILDGNILRWAADYFKNPSEDNFARIQHVFKRVMALRNQKKLLKADLFHSLRKQQIGYLSNYSDSVGINEGAVYSLDSPPALYNLESQVEAYSGAVESNKAYNKGIENRLLSRIIPLISAKPAGGSKLEIIALGCGSGIHEYDFISEFIEQKKIKEDQVRLYLTDVNESMIEEAVANAENENFKRIKTGKKPINASGFKIDFFNSIYEPLEKRSQSRSRLFLFLGTTLGNFDTVQQEIILKNINDAMTFSNFYQQKPVNSTNNFIVGVKGMHYKDGNPDKEKMEEEYRLTEDFSYKPLQILGFEKQDFEKYNTDLYVEKDVISGGFVPKIVCYFPLAKPTSITFENDTITFNKGDVIKVINSQRFEKERLDKKICDRGRTSSGPLKKIELLEEEGYIVGLYEKAY